MRETSHKPPMDFGKVRQPGLAKHDSSVLDLAFVMDCTSSMTPYINQAQQSIRWIAEQIVAHENSDVHMALVEFRDHPPQDRSFVTRTHDFTPSIGTMESWLDAASADGGGDWPEAVADGLYDLLKLSWREGATKIGILVVDAPPHGLINDGVRTDTFPDGCPDKLDPVHITNELAEKGVTLYVVGCEPKVEPCKEFYSAMAYITGGQYVPLRNASLLSQVIIGGALEEMSLQRLLAEVETEVQQEISQSGADIDEEVLAGKVHKKFAAKGTTSVALHRNGMAMPEASKFAQRMSKLSSMAAVRGAYTNNGLASDEYSSTDPVGAAAQHTMNPSTTHTYMGAGLSGGSCVHTPGKATKRPAPAYWAHPSSGMAHNTGAPSSHGPHSDSYTSSVQRIQPQQTQRLVQKAIKKQKTSTS